MQINKTSYKFLWALELILVTITISQSFLEQAEASTTASANARITATVMRSLSIEKVSDLDFGAAYQGSDEQKVNTDMKNAAKFLVHGEPGKAFSIVLPEKVLLVPVIKNKSSDNDTISVSQFVSYPNNTGLMDRNGKTSLVVGATRGKIEKQQKNGEYSGQFTITVTYQ